jgi:F-type H+-transporting ATPase subunit gamma
MANIRLIKRRIKSAQNISQITKAMELVAASKMRKAQAQAIAGKLYAEKIYEMVVTLGKGVEKSVHPFLHPPKKLTGKRLVILFSSNKGLCGGLNTQLFRFTLRAYESITSCEFVTLGKKGAMFAGMVGLPLKADFSDTSSFVSKIPAIMELVTQEFLEGRVDGVDLIYNEFVSIVKQIPKKKTILPLSVELTEGTQTGGQTFKVEPSPEKVFESLLPHYLENQIRDAILQAEASEHSARMVAMRNATDNAMSLRQELTLVYNKARQEKITSEITDMVTARLAVEG